MPAPLVSVCLPTYNYSAFVGKAIESVLAQKVADFELLVFDDASTDDTARAVERYLSDDRVKFVRHEKNQGLFTNFNLSARAARGRYVKYLCADDWLDERFLEQTLPLLQNNETLVMATTANWLVDAGGVLIGEQSAGFRTGPVVSGADVARALAEWGNVIGMPTNTLIRREDLLAVGGFDGRFAPAADVHLWLKLLARGDVGWVRRPCCFVRIHARHSHDYGPDPTEAMFLAWEDAAKLPGVPVEERMLRRALYREARRCLLYVVAHLIRLRGRKALAIWRFTRRHIRVLPTLMRFALDIPQLAYGQVARIFALRTGRMVVYGPAPRAGERLVTARTRIGSTEHVE